MRKMVSSSQIAEEIKKARKVAVFGHVLPDSDCYGSVFGMKIGLESIGKKVFAYLDVRVPYDLVFLKDYGDILVEKEAKEVDLVLIFDTSSVDRVESNNILNAYKQKGIPIFLVDHHLEGDLAEYSDFVWEDSKMSSTSEMALSILKDLNVPIKKDLATFLLTGIEGDTGSFQHQSTTKESMEAAAYLLSKGARFRSVVDNAVNSKRDLDILKLYGLAMERIIYNKEYGVITTYLTLEDMKKFGLNGESPSGVINFLNIIEGAKILVTITEMEGGNLKISLRTRDEKVNVQKLASFLGGGGHIKASGFTTKGKIELKDGKVKII